MRTRRGIAVLLAIVLCAALTPVTGAAAGGGPGLAAVSAAEPTETPTVAGQWVPDAQVDRLAAAPDGTVYASGQFTHVGPLTGSGAMIGLADNEVLRPWPFVRGDLSWGIDAVVADGAGGYYIGGTFSEVGGVPRANLAHIRADGALDTTFSVDVTSTAAVHVRALQLVGDTLYIGGEFTSVAGTARTNAAAVDVRTRAVTAWDPAPDMPVYALAADAGHVYLGGQFLNVHGDYHAVLARTDPVTGEPGTWSCDGDGIVEALTVHDGVLYASGFFEKLNSSVRHYIGAVDASTGAVVDPWDPGAGMSGGTCLSLVATGTTLYAAGTYTAIGGVSRNCMAALDISPGSTGTVRPWDPGADGWVKALRLRGGRLYAGGTFLTIGGDQRSRGAAFDITGVSPTLTDFDARADNEILAIDAATSTAYVGGLIRSAGQHERTYLAAFAPDGTLTSWNPTVNNHVNAISYGNGALYIGGGFTTVNGQPRLFVAALDATGALTDWDPAPDSTVYSLRAQGDRVYVGGQFTVIGGRFISRFARVASSPATGAADAWDPGVTGGNVLSIAVTGTTVYVAGGFTGVNHPVDGLVPRASLAAFDASASGPPLLPWDPQAARSGGGMNMSAVEALGSRIYVGGLFDTVGGAARRNLAALSPDGTGTAEAGFAPEPNLSVGRMVGSAEGLYTMGDFQAIGGQSRRYIALLDPETGAPRTWTMPTPNNRPRALVRTGRHAVVGGMFYTLYDNTMGVANLTRFTVPAPKPALRRIGGADRYEVAAALARDSFPGWKSGSGTVGAVIIACGSDAKAADPLGAAGLAGAMNAPILLVRNDTRAFVPKATTDALASLVKARKGSKVEIVLVGGTASVTAAHVNALKPYARSFKRMDGRNRYEVAANVAAEIKRRSGNVNPPFVLIASGASADRFYDPLALGPIAARNRVPVLLTADSTIPVATTNALASLAPDVSKRFVAADVTVVSDSACTSMSATRIPGLSRDRGRFAAALADHALARGWIGCGTIGLVNKLADALAGGSAIGRAGGPVLYTTASGGVDPATSAFIDARADRIATMTVIGGPASVPSSTIDPLYALW